MTFRNQQIQLQAFFPDLETPLAEPLVGTVNEGVEFSLTSSEIDSDETFTPGYNIDLSDNSIVLETVEAPVENPLYQEGDFNGFIFSDVSNEIPAIEQVNIDRADTNLDVDAADVTFTEDTISLNLEGTSYTPGEQLKLDVVFESTSDPVESLDSSIEINISSPNSITADGTDEVTVTYTNTGDSDAIAPLLNLEANGALLQPNGEAEFDASQIQFLGISNEGQAGTLAPGESNSFSVRFMPDGTNESEIDFSVSTVDEDTVIDWESLRESSRPDFISPQAWDIIYDNFLAEVGTTAADYQQLLVENANYLSGLGEYEANVDNLLAFEFEQANNYRAISQRYSLGSFGRGRTFIGDVELSTDEEGNVFIDNGGTRRTFNLLPDGTYQGELEFTTISLDEATGVYTLSEPDGTAIVFNADGQIDFIEDTNGNRLDAVYTGEQLTSLTDSFGNSLTFAYNDDSRIVTATDSGRTTTYGYDETGELLTSVTDEAGTTTYTYDGVALASVTDPNGTTIEFAYDNRGRLTRQSISGESTATEVLNYSYGEAGQITVTDGLGNETELLLDENAQVGQLTDANGRSLDFSYDNQGNLTQILTPDDNSSLFGYDNQGNLTSEVDAEGNKTEFTYEESFNQLTSLTDPRGNGIDYSYDESGNLTAIEYEDGSSESFSYDDNGNVTISVNRRGQEILYSYNDRGQIVRQINPDGSVPIEYTYDASGNIDTVTDGSGTIDLDYDQSDRLTKITYPGGRFLEYTYDAGDRRTSLTDRDGDRVNYTYDAAGRLASLTDGDDNLIVSYQYDEVGRLSREDKGNGTYTVYRYDLANQPLSIENYAPDDTLNSSSTYAYDSLGRQISLTTLDGEWTYDYDAIAQLTGAVFNSTNPDIPNQNIAYEYDAVGNRVNTIENGENTEYTTNNLNQYTEVDGFEYEYDDDGNLTSKTNEEGTFTYAYNSENQLVSLTEPNGIVTTYEYDAFGNRIASDRDGERTEYLVDPFGFGNVVGEYDEDGNLTASYTHGLGLESTTNAEASFYYDFNATGSTVNLTNADGSVANSYFYDPFGNDIAETEAVANPFEFVGQFGVAEEANGLDFMRNRFYDSDTGRFTSPDPIGINGGDTNLYRYVENNPTNLVDPEGNLAFLPILYSVGRGVGVNVGLYLLTTPRQDLTVGGFAGSIVGGVFGGTRELLLFKSVPRIGKVILNINNSVFATLLAKSTELIIENDPTAIGSDTEFLTDIGLSAIFGPLPGLDRFPGIGRFLRPLFSEAKKVVNDIANGLARNLTDTFIGDERDRSTTDIESEVDSDEIPLPPDNQGRSKGEPHLTTLDGVGYDFQGAGEFTLVESVDDDLNIQVRYVQIDDNVTVASAVATEIDGQNVVIDSEGIQFDEDGNPFVTRSGGGAEATVTVDGEEVEIVSGGSIDVGDSRIYRSSGDEYTIVYAGENGTVEDGDDQLVVNYFRPGTINIADVYLGDEQQGQVAGLLGNFNGNPDDDIALRDGTVLPRPLEFDRLYGDYREDYRVSNIEESLFTYEEGQNPNTFYNPNFPQAAFTYEDLPPELKAKGDAAALEAGYEPGTFAFESVAFDFAVTCDPGFLEGLATDPDAIDVDIIDDADTDPANGTASISGIKFNDLNGNGDRDSDGDDVLEPGLAGVSIYLDENNNGVLDEGEPLQVTATDNPDTSDIDETGQYEFSDLSAGVYTVREVVPEGYEQTFPVTTEANAGDGFADVILDYFDSGEGPLEGPYGIDENNENAVPVSTDIILGSDEEGALSLPTGSFVTVGFTDEVIVDGEGDDIFIPEEGAAGDRAEVFVSSDLENFTLIGTGNGGTTSVFDLGSINFTEPVRAVKIVGLDNRGLSPGFDVINIQGLPDSVVTPDFYTVELSANEVVENIDFGNNFTETIEPPGDDSTFNNFEDAQIQLQVFSPDLETPISEPATATVDEDVEFAALPSLALPGSSIVDVSIDIAGGIAGEGSILFEVNEETDGEFGSGDFNGYILTDVSDEIPAIENVTIDESTNTLGLESSDITFSENTIEVNVESIAYEPEDSLLLEVEFADV